MSVLGIDIGGANIKVAHSNAEAEIIPFELWNQPEELTGKLRSIRATFPDSDVWHVTMTGELCDCFCTKEDGVNTIIDSVVSVNPTQNSWFWSTEGMFLSARLASQNYLSVAAANWHALGSVIARRYYPETNGILVDVGSTTTDIIPLNRGMIATDSKTDTDRLRRRELVYTGVGRTVVSSIVQSVPLSGGDCPIASEYFADIRDVHLVLGWRREEYQNLETADNRPLTLENSKSRLARLICSDNTLCSERELKAIANAIAQNQLAMLRSAFLLVQRRLGPVQNFTISGSGEFLGELLLDSALAKHHKLSDIIAKSSSTAACAWALTKLNAKYVS